MPAKDPRPTSYFRLNLSGAESAAAFQKFSGLKSSTKKILTYAVDDQGRPVQISVPGATTWDDVTIERIADENMELWKWRDQVIKEGPAKARKDCTIEQLDYTGTRIAAWKLLNAWPMELAASPMSAGDNNPAAETMKLAHDGCEKVG
jgi:phage tail-like protein